jgi:hypothetical protein
MGRLDAALEKAASMDGSIKDTMPETMIITHNEAIDRRKYRRYLKKLTVKISSGSLRRSGIMRDVSGNGMLVTSGKDFIRDMAIDIELSLPNQKTSFLKGRITRNVEIPESNWLKGVGIYLTEKDETFLNFLATLT